MSDFLEENAAELIAVLDNWKDALDAQADYAEKAKRAYSGMIDLAKKFVAQSDTSSEKAIYGSEHEVDLSVGGGAQRIREPTDQLNEDSEAERRQPTVKPHKESTSSSDTSVRGKRKNDNEASEREAFVEFVAIELKKEEILQLPEDQRIPACGDIWIGMNPAARSPFFLMAQANKNKKIKKV